MNSNIQLEGRCVCAGGDKQILVSSTSKYFLRILVFDWYTGGKKNLNIELSFYLILELFYQCFPCFNFLTFLFPSDRFPIGGVVTNLFHCPRPSHPSGLTNNLETPLLWKVLSFECYVFLSFQLFQNPRPSHPSGLTNNLETSLLWMASQLVWMSFKCCVFHPFFSVFSIPIFVLGGLNSF